MDDLVTTPFCAVVRINGVYPGFPGGFSKFLVVKSGGTQVSASHIVRGTLKFRESWTSLSIPAISWARNNGSEHTGQNS
jgi:hypothetical protein